MTHLLPPETRVARPARIGLWAVCLACALVGLAARLYGLGDKPFWLDEVTTLQRSALPLGAQVYNSLSFHHLPTYFVISGWFLHLGDGGAALRLPAALFGALSCALVAGLAGRVARALPARGADAGDPRHGAIPAALLAGLLMALAPVEVQYGQEARSYSLLICLVLIGLGGLIEVLRAAPLPAPRRAWLAYAGGTLGGLLVLGMAWSWFAIANLVALWVLRGAVLRRWLWVQLAIVLLAAPGFVAMVVLVERVHGTFQSGLDWIPPLAWPHVRITLESLYGLRLSSLIADRLFAQPAPWLGVLCVMLAAAGALRLDRRSSAVLLLCAAGVPVSVALISLVEPLFMPRYLLWSTAPFLLLVGCGVVVLPRSWRWPAACGLAAVALINLLPYYRAETKPRWDLAAHRLQAELQPGDVLLIDDPGAVNMMNVTLAHDHAAAIQASQWTQDVGAAGCALADGHRVWAVQGRVGQADRETRQDFLALLTPLGPPQGEWPIGLDIVLQRYDTPVVGACAGSAGADTAAGSYD